MLSEALYFAGGGLGCALEYLHIGFRPVFEQRWAVAGSKALIDKVWQHRTTPDGTMALKLFWRDIAELVAEVAPNRFPCLRTTPADAISPEIYQALNAVLRTYLPNPTHIYLDRHDHLRQAVSSVAATQTKIWRRIAGADSEGQPAPVNYNFDEIVSALASNAFCKAHWQAFFAANGIRPYTISYEDLVSDYTNVVEDLLSALGQPGPAPAIRMLRQSTAENEALIRRFLQDQRSRARQ